MNAPRHSRSVYVDDDHPLADVSFCPDLGLSQSPRVIRCRLTISNLKVCVNRLREFSDEVVSVVRRRTTDIPVAGDKSDQCAEGEAHRCRIVHDPILVSDRAAQELSEIDCAGRSYFPFTDRQAIPSSHQGFEIGDRIGIVSHAEGD